MTPQLVNNLGGIWGIQMGHLSLEAKENIVRKALNRGNSTLITIANYSKDIFINCPFDNEFLDLFYAKVFCVIDCGFRARCAQEAVDSGEVRIEKVTRIILQCKYGIHDISRTELCKKTKLPRFNMPLELGIFLGAKRYGDSEQRRKVCLITDTDK